ncbi:MAG: type II secretion system protein [Gammaproteobacteria bacterium]|nr:type II secretion system protein [Gammaproteobacteria bacterium]
MNIPRSKLKGFSLLEMILVMAIMSAILIVLINYSTQKADALRRENIAKEMQQVLNAALAFYVTNGAWPGKTVGSTKTLCSAGSWLSFDGTADLQIQNYLPPAAQMPTVNGQSYQFDCNVTTGLFQIRVPVSLPADQTIIAGMVPLGAVVTVAGVTYVQGQVNVPGQNLNNARSLNFAGVYYAGSCVPAPTCPLGMTPNIVVTPSAVSGMTDSPSCSGSSLSAPYDPSNCSGAVYPVSSFIGFARGDSSGAPTDPNGNALYKNANNNAGPPLDCKVTATPSTLACQSNETGGTLNSDGTLYWRVCLYVRTENGIAYPNTSSGAPTSIAWGKMLGTVLVFTRCVPTNEPIGSNDVWQPNAGYTP